MVLKVIVLMLIYGVLGYSGFSLIGLLSEHGSQLQQDIFIKLQFFFYMHIFVAVAIVPLLKLEDPFHTMLYSFFACLILFLAFFVCQKVTHGQKKEDGELLNQFDKSQDESTYVQYYYIVYGAALTGAGVTGFVVVASQILSYLRGPPVTRYDGILQTVDFNESLQGTQCSICLNDCTKEQTYSMIKKCGHIFHQDCLKEWLKYDKVCPLDRTNIMP